MTDYILSHEQNITYDILNDIDVSKSILFNPIFKTPDCITYYYFSINNYDYMYDKFIIVLHVIIRHKDYKENITKDEFDKLFNTTEFKTTLDIYYKKKEMYEKLIDEFLLANKLENFSYLYLNKDEYKKMQYLSFDNIMEYSIKNNLTNFINILNIINEVLK